MAQLVAENLQCLKCAESLCRWAAYCEREQREQYTGFFSI